MKTSKKTIQIKSFCLKPLLFVSLYFFLILATSCETTEPPPSNQSITLTAEEASCTEAWLNLKTENIPLPTKVKITQNDSVTQIINLSDNIDTTLYIDNLLPSKTYNFQTIIQTTNQKSNSVSITTMDTTSHNFTWESFTFGGVNGSSYLKDVAIINENNIWAVGEIHTAETDQFDSNGVWVQPYNAVHWDGEKWELKRILYNNNFWTINTILAFNENDIWFDVFVHWNGSSFSNDAIPNVLMGWRSNSLWGTSSKDFYVVGNGGNIAHYNGSSWTKIESSTEEILSDIYGIDNDIYIAGGSNIAYTGVLLKGDSEGFNIIKEGTSQYVDTIFSPYFVGSLSSVWLSSTGTLYFGGQALYKSKFNQWDFDRTLEGNCLRCNEGGQYYATISKIRGNADNDIILVGARNTLRHFNGVSWKQLGREYDPNDPSILWYSVAMHNNIAIVVGSEGGRAAIMKLIQ
jgi:hypothetical protein